MSYLANPVQSMCLPRSALATGLFLASVLCRSIARAASMQRMRDPIVPGTGSADAVDPFSPIDECWPSWWLGESLMDLEHRELTRIPHLMVGLSSPSCRGQRSGTHYVDDDSNIPNPRLLAMTRRKRNRSGLKHVRRKAAGLDVDGGTLLSRAVLGRGSKTQETPRESSRN